MKIETVDVGLYTVPLATTLTDSTHGNMSFFELITVRIGDADGATGVGYTYTVNAGGAAVAVMIERYLSDVLRGEDADRIEHLCRLCGTPHKRHSAAMRFLHAGIDTSVIALWLGHENTATTGIYLHADLAIKQQALDRTRPPETPPGRYQPDDPLLAWLNNL